jgi:hypothetical protein
MGTMWRKHFLGSHDLKADRKSLAFRRKASDIKDSDMYSANNFESPGRTYD